MERKKWVYFTGGIIFFMFCLSFASIPLYRMFCQKTGYGGTTQQSAYHGHITNRMIKLEFVANCYKDVPFDFKPLQFSMNVQVGKPFLAFYQVYNRSTKPIKAIAVYNVSPFKMGPFFHKIECFCFEERIIPPQREVILPVQFFIHSDMIKEKKLKNLKTLTLSYTFFHYKDYTF